MNENTNSENTNSENTNSENDVKETTKAIEAVLEKTTVELLRSSSFRQLRKRAVSRLMIETKANKPLAAYLALAAIARAAMRLLEEGKK